MATLLHERAPPRKKIATYGKAARRRIPELNLIATTQKSQTPERAEETTVVTPSPAPVASPAPETPRKSNVVPRRSVSRTPSSVSPHSGDIFAAPVSDDDDPTPVPKKIPTPPLKTKPKPIRQKDVIKQASAKSSTADIWDVPDDEPPKQIRKVTPPAKLKPAPRKSPSVSPPSTSPRNVFDMPSSDDEKPLLSAKRSITTMQKASTTHKLNKVETSASLAEGSKKKLRLSPAPDPALKAPPNKTTHRQPRSHPAARPPQNQNSSLKAGQVTRMVARPKILALPKKVEAPLNPLPQSPKLAPRKKTAPSTPSPMESDLDVDMVDVEPTKAHISPRGLEMWQGLLDSVEDAEEEVPKNNGIVNASGNRGRPLGTKTYTLSRHAGVSKASQNNSRLLPRRRLIDTLVEQAQLDTDDSSEEEDDEFPSDSAPASQQSIDVIMVSESQIAVPEPPKPALLATENQGSQIGPRITYTRVRSMLNEEDIMKQLEMELPAQAAHTSQTQRPRRVSISSLKPQGNSYEADAEDEGPAPAIRSVHELRLAGANNRFLNAIEDFLERIGSPSKTQSSMRRAALLDMATQMKDKNFSRQFRDHGIEQKLFLHLGQEVDIIAGFLMVSLLITVLMDGNMPHIVSQLRRHGITRLIIRLLECQQSIIAISKERKSNMSKSMQSLVAEHHDHLLRLSTWEDLKPETMSPRSLALKCLELMVRQTRQAGLTGEIFSKELTTSLFAIMRTSSDERSWQLPADKQAIDFYLALSALESHSLTARTVHDESIWISEYLPIIADTLEVALLRPIESYGILQVLLLRLTLNVTNNNLKASEIFIRPRLMSTIAAVTAAKFRQILRFLREEELDVVLEHLVLILGVMINFSEWSSGARESLQGLQGQIDDPLDLLIRIFTDNRDQTSMADSMEESSKNVAFGYLSVLLGYLALLPAICERIRNAQSRKSLRPLVLSIEEFINFHKVVENQQFADDIDGHNPQIKLTERWESLVGQLAPLI